MSQTDASTIGGLIALSIFLCIVFVALIMCTYWCCCTCVHIRRKQQQQPWQQQTGSSGRNSIRDVMRDGIAFIMRPPPYTERPTGDTPQYTERAVNNMGNVATLDTSPYTERADYTTANEPNLEPVELPIAASRHNPPSYQETIAMATLTARDASNMAASHDNNNNTNVTTFGIAAESVSPVSVIQAVDMPMVVMAPRPLAENAPPSYETAISESRG